MVIVIFLVVVFGLGTLAVFGGVIFTVKLHRPAVKPFTLLPAMTAHTVFVDDVATMVDFATTVMPSVFSDDRTAAV